MTTPDAISRNRLIDKKELRKLVPLSPSTVYRLERDGQFPKRIRLGRVRVAWSLPEILAWIDCQKQGRVWRADISSRVAAHG